MKTKKEQRHTYEEILEMFEKDDTLDIDFKNEIRGRLDAFYQSMYDCVHHKEDTMESAEMLSPYGDHFIEEINRIKTIYQRYEHKTI